MTIVALVIVAVILCLAIILSSLYFFDITREHDLATSRRAITMIDALITEYAPQAKTFLDLGCGRGSVAVRLKKARPGLQVEGVDNSALRLFFARIKGVFRGTPVTWIQDDIFHFSARDADVVYAYLWYDHLPPLEKKLLAELKEGSLVITNTSHFPEWREIKKIIVHPDRPQYETLYVYQR